MLLPDNQIEEEFDPSQFPEQVGVDIGDGSNGRTIIDGVLIQQMPDGSVMVDLDGGAGGDMQAPEGCPWGSPDEHDANLACFMDETDLNAIAQEIIEAVDADLESRQEWYERIARGLELLGIKEQPDAKLGVFKIAKNISHPLIAEAAVQFQARAVAELFPAKGPVKALVLGEKTRKVEEQSERVEDFMNYQLTIEDRTYFEESDQLMFMLSLEGSQFRKGFKDPINGKNRLRWVRAEDFVVPYNTTSLESAPRYTHRITETQNDAKKKMRSWYYRQTELPQPTGMGAADSATAGENALAEKKDELEGKSAPSNREEDAMHLFEECHIDYDLPGFEDVDDNGEKTGVALPYIITVERESQKVVAIYRNWREIDPLKEKRIWFSHYKYLPGTGFYGFGLLHVIGGLGAGATAILRAISVGAAFAGAQGGFKTKEAKIGSDVTLEPGKYKDTEHTYEELQKLFYTPSFKEPPEALFKVLGLITEAGQRFASTTESMVGDAKNTGPVGTTVALIEQGSKVFSGIHKRCHFAQAVEFKILSDLNGENLPDEGYPYAVPGASKSVFAEDFSDHVDVIPVSDPNVFSSTQRIAIAQAGVEMANAAPDLFDRREAYRRMAEALRFGDVDTLMPDKTKVRRADPVTENAMLLMGEQIKVFPDQNHDAHIAVHMGELQMLAARGSPSLQMIQPQALSHIAEHEAYALRLKMMQAMQVRNLPALEGGDEQQADIGQMQLPPEMENAIAVRAAQVTQAMLEQLAQARQQAEGGQGGQGEQGDAQAAASEERRKDMAAQAGERRADMKTQGEIDRKDATAGLDPATVRAASQYLAQRGLDGAVSPRQLSVVSRALGSSFDQTVRMLMFMRSGGQGNGEAPIAGPALIGRKF